MFRLRTKNLRWRSNKCHPPVVSPLLLSCKLRIRFICQSIIWYPCIKHICFWIKWYWLLKSNVFLSQWTLSYPNCKHNLWYRQSGIHANHRVTNLNLISTASLIISLKSSLIICFAILSYNIIVWATCNNLPRETYQLERQDPGRIFFFLIKKIEAKPKDTNSLAVKLLSLLIHFIAQSVFLFTQGKNCIAFSILCFHLHLRFTNLVI